MPYIMEAMKLVKLLGSATKACSKIGTLATSEDESFKGVYTPFDKVVLNKTCGFAFVPCTNLDDTTKVVIAASEYALYNPHTLLPCFIHVPSRQGISCHSLWKWSLHPTQNLDLWLLIFMLSS
jgi:hypothetical protein